VNEDELRDLIERDAQVQEMTQHPGWALLQDYMRAQMEAKQRWLIIGNADTLEEYRRMTGWLQGVGDALSAPEALAAQVDRARREVDAPASA
jgi:hypothetical protein